MDPKRKILALTALDESTQVDHEDFSSERWARGGGREEETNRPMIGSLDDGRRARARARARITLP